MVTRGASGIGAAVARSLAARGAHVIVADLDESGAAELAEEVEGSSCVVDLAPAAAPRG